MSTGIALEQSDLREALSSIARSLDVLISLQQREVHVPTTLLPRSPISEVSEATPRATTNSSASLLPAQVHPAPADTSALGDITGNFAEASRLPRRDTFGARIADNFATIVPTVHRELPDYSKIRFSRFSVAHAFVFFEAIDQYKRINRHTVPAASLVSDQVRDQIVVCNPYIVSEYAFISLTNEELYAATQRALRPRSMFEFVSVLQSTIQFPPLPTNYTPSAHDFDIMFSAISTFQRRFLFCHEFLALDNAANIPRCDARDGGSIRVFIDAIPFDFGRNIWQGMASTKFSYLFEFLDAFMLQVKQVYTSFLATRSNSQYFRVSSSPQGNMAESNPNYGARSSAGSQQRSQQHQQHKTQHQPSSVQSQYNRPVSQLRAMYHGMDTDDLELCEDFLGPQGDEAEPVQSSSFAVMSVNSQPCRRHMFGTCEASPCKFSHDPAALRELCQRDMERLKLCKYYVPMAPKRTPPQFASISAEEADDVFVDAQLSIISGSVLSQIGADPSIRSRARHVATILVQDTMLDTVSVLFDTGANDSSYVSKDWVDLHRSELREAAKLASCDVLIGLADSAASSRVTETCELRVIMTHAGVEYEATVLCRVLAGLAYTLVLGMPEIAGPFVDLHIRKLKEATPKIERADSSCRLLVPWSQPVDPNVIDSAEEEAPLPVMFEDALHFLGMTHQQAIEEFLALIPTQVSAEMRNSTSVETLLRSKGVLVFVPSNWTGINGIEPIEFEWSDDLPKRRIPKVRRVNTKLLVPAEREFTRLGTYHLVPSHSPIASNDGFAPKNTAPFVRFVGDYAWINKYIKSGASVIPDVRAQIDRILGYGVFLDLDLANAFHQLPLGPITSDRLSLVTLWGQVRPVFLPEGVTPASGLLQEVVSGIFADFMDFMIIIFDNLLVLAHDMDDAMHKLELVLDRCIARNVFLKFPKSFIGFREVHFFGYLCRLQSFGLTNNRKLAITSIPMPTSHKTMQRFLGAALFFKSFIPHFSSLTADLHDMTRSDFSWSLRPWPKDYAAVFESFKKALLHACELFYPDYTKEWVLRVDASDRGVGAVLFQKSCEPDGTEVHQPLVFASKKFSDVALRWSVYEKEAFALYFGVSSCDYYLRAKPFTLETDHRNLQWLESSEIPKVVRWRLYLQGFRFMLRHIPGKVNSVADWQSRLHAISTLSLSRQHALEACHVGRAGHMGVKRTWALLNRNYPGHCIPVAVVADYIASCATCQKVRLYMGETLKPVQRHLKQEDIRSMVGIDTLELPEDSDGFRYLHVFRNLFSKLVTLYPVRTRDAESMAKSIFSYYATYGIHDCFISDPGSDLTAQITEALLAWLGIHHRFSIIGRHESNGVEAANRQIKRYLTAIFSDERVSKRWSDVSVLGWVSVLMNTYDVEETGCSPYVITFGSAARHHFKAPLQASDVPGYVKQLDADLATIRDLVKQHQHLLKPEITAPQNFYQPGDFVLLHKTVEYVPFSKLHPRYLGPFRVILHTRNEVECAHLVSDKRYVFHVTDVRLFVGSQADAFNAAQLDADQFLVESIIQYRGDPHLRTTMEFLVRFVDGTEHWIPYSDDITSTVHYEIFCKSISHLRVLLYTTAMVPKVNADINRSAITEVSVGDTVYVDLRSYGHLWFDHLRLPDIGNRAYVLKYLYVRISLSKRVIWARCDLFQEEWKLNHVFVHDYGTKKIFDPRMMVLIDEEFLRAHPYLVSPV